jgi:propionyl-CoA synthetase
LALSLFKKCGYRERLPKTRSGKPSEIMRSIADGDDFQIPSTIDDEAIVEEKSRFDKYEINL